jgi:rubrerythrin
MKSTTTPGLNRTGLAASPLHAKDVMELTTITVPSSEGESADALSVRALYAKEAPEPQGTVPLPASLKEVASQLKQALKGQKGTVLLDKLGERLAFERTGTRLYEGILLKFDTFGSWEGGPERAELEKIHADELRHFKLVRDAIAALGSDPTAMTPSANLAAVASEGVLKVISDARTTLKECLDAIIIAELADNDCWSNLVELTRAAGLDELAARFDEAVANERDHLLKVRQWISAALGTSMGVMPMAREAMIAQLQSTRRPPQKRAGNGAATARRLSTGGKVVRGKIAVRGQASARTATSGKAASKKKPGGAGKRKSRR